MYAMTVLGAVEVEKLGFTLPHEHILFDTTCFLFEPDDPWKKEIATQPVSLENCAELRREPLMNRDNAYFMDEGIALHELELYKRAGGRTIVDVSPPALGRNAEALRRLAEASSVNIIAATGHYVQFTHPPEVAQQTAEELAAWMIREITEGIDGAQVKAGVIGEIGISPGGIHPDELKLLRGAAFAQNETGVPISIHNAIPFERQGMRVIKILEESGARIDRVIMGHMHQSTGELEYHRRLADTGAVLEFDRFGAEFYNEHWEGLYTEPRDSEVVPHVARLVEDGYADRILLSHDIGFKIQLASFGGFGFAHVPRRIVPYLKGFGVTDDELEQVTVRNPARLFALDESAPSSPLRHRGRRVTAAALPGTVTG